MKTGRYIRSIWLLLLMAASCLEPYRAPDVPVNVSALVVDAAIVDAASPGFAIATIRLSRTAALSSTKAIPEQRATVSIEQVGSNKIQVIPESQAEAGFYTTSFAMDNQKSYKLHIISKGKNYFSDVLQYQKAPPIDNLFYETTDEGVQIYLSTHDPASNSGFYRWTFTETWHYRAQYDPRSLILNGRIINRPNLESTYNCWNTKPSTKILVSSSENLSQNVINRFPLTFIPKGSPKISVKYSIIVEQQSLTQPAFSFWQQLQKTTESIGGLFDPQPSRVTGNIHNASDASEPVLGYVTWGSITSRRIFIDLFDLPSSFNVSHISECPLVEIMPDAVSTVSGPVLLVSEAPIYTSNARCLDCRVDGGSLTKPAFWP